MSDNPFDKLLQAAPSQNYVNRNPFDDIFEIDDLRTGVLITAPGPTENPDPGFSRILPGSPGTFDWEPKSDPASRNNAPETNRQIGNLYSAVASP